jgi:hypothetical protein
MLTFGIVVASNNLIALKAFYVFLFNYELHEKPSFWERWIIPRARGWIQREAISTFKDLIKQLGEVNLTLNDCSTSMFTILYLAKHPEMFNDLKDGVQLFRVMADTELEFERLKKPRKEEKYSNGE